MSAMGAVLGTSLVSVSGEMSRQDRDDLFDCLLAADHKAGRVSREENFSFWNYRFGMSMELRGCTKTAAIQHKPAVINSASALKSITFGVTCSVGSDALASQAIASLEAMQIRGLAGQFFVNGSGQSDLARFQVVPCIVDDSGHPSVIVCGIQLTGYADVRDYDFWTQTSRDMVLRISGGAYRFNRDAYAVHREKIRQQLADSARGAIQAFEF